MKLTKNQSDNYSIKKRISVSQKRQITIPIEFFNSVGIDKEVECFIQNNAIVIRPIRDNGGEFDEQILADLISQGFSGKALLDKFKETRRQVRPAIKKLLEEANLAAEGLSPSENYEKVFNTESK